MWWIPAYKEDGSKKTYETKDLDGYHQNGVFNAASVLRGRFILTSTNYETPNEKEKVHYIVQGFNDNEKTEHVHDTANIRPPSTRLVLSVAVVFEFQMFTHDVTQAYLKSKNKMCTDIYLKVKQRNVDIFGILLQDSLKIEKPLYGKCNSGDYWGMKIDAHEDSNLGRVFLVSDSDLYVRFDNGTPIRVSGIQVDNSITVKTSSSKS